MDPKVKAVMDAYQARAEAERARMDDPNRRLDDLLLPVGLATATLLNLLIKEADARAILEVGTSYGYSTIWLAEAAQATGGRVITLESHAGKIEYARARMATAGLGQFVELRHGDARETLRSLPGPFDFVLIDLWKSLYVPCFELIYPKLAPGAIVVADNMLYPESTRSEANAYREHVRAAPQMSSILLPVGSGIEVSRYR